MRKLLTIFFLLITPVTFSQGFLARIDIRHVEDINDSTWRIVGDIVDVTGGYDGLDVDTGFIIFQRGVDTSGITIYDRIKIDSIENATTVQLEAIVVAQYALRNNSFRPMSGSFPMMEELDTTNLLYKPSWYRYAFEGDYETGVDNENLTRLYNLITILDDSTSVDLAAIYDSLEVHFDTMVVHRTNVNAIYDSLARHTDTLQYHLTSILALRDTVALHLDTLQSHNTRINNLVKYDNRYEINVSSDSENNWPVPFNLRSSSVIIYNGDPLKSNQWSAVSPAILTVNVDVRKYDHIVLIN